MTRHDLDAIIQGGESHTVEFKRNGNSDLSKEMRHEWQVGIDRTRRMLLIAQELVKNNKIDIDLLSNQHATSGRTIRRDLEILEEYGWVKSLDATRNKGYSITAKEMKRLKDLGRFGHI